MHLACHMSKCLEDFGPVHSFWCFAFERLNGQLGAIPTNNLSVEVQLMRKFVDGMFINSYIPQLQEPPEIQPLLQLLKHPTKRGTIGSFNQSIDDSPVQTTFTSTEREFTTDELTHMIIQSIGQEIVCGSKLETALTVVEHTTLTDICKAIFGSQLCRVDFVCHIFSQMFMRGQNYGTVSSRLLRSANIKAYHTVNSGLLTNTIGTGTIQKFLQVGITLYSGVCEKKELISFAQVKWLSTVDLEEHQLEQNFFPVPVQMWTDSSHTNCNAYVSFVPVASIITRVAVTHSSSNTHLSLPPDLMLTIPLQSSVIDLISS